MGRSWQTLNFKTNKICQQYVGPCFPYNPHYVVVVVVVVVLLFLPRECPKVEQVFPHATCNNHSFVVLFVD